MAKQVIGIGTVADDGTGDPLRTVFDKTNDNFTELYDAKRFGIYDYSNSLSAQSFTGTPIVLQNNGAGVFTYKNILTGVADVYNTSTYEFDFSDLSIGDVVTIRVDITVTTTSANQELDVYLDLAQGTPSNYQIRFATRAFKTASSYALADIVNFVYMGNTDTKNNPAELIFNSDANATVFVNGWACKVDKQLI